LVSLVVVLALAIWGGFLVNRQAQLEISDTGPGIPTNDLPHVFERFFRADPGRLGTIEGAGLGLSIVQSCGSHEPQAVTSTEFI
jgi:signal transduction histidine kinase